MKYYTGIGSRDTPKEILEIMTKFAVILEKEGYTLRSGGATGADEAFAKDVSNKEIFLPWENFNGLKSDFIGNKDEAYEIAKNIHPAWDKCSTGAKKLHSRNIHQLFGWDMCPKTYSQFVICWTKDGKIQGGTATVIKLAIKENIQVINLGNVKDYKIILSFLKSK